MATRPSPRKLNAALERLRERLEAVGRAVVDEDIHAQLTPLSSRLSEVALMLGEPTRTNLARAAGEIADVSREFEAMVRLPVAAARATHKRR